MRTGGVGQADRGHRYQGGGDDGADNDDHDPVPRGPLPPWRGARPAGGGLAVGVGVIGVAVLGVELGEGRIARS